MVATDTADDDDCGATVDPLPLVVGIIVDPCPVEPEAVVIVVVDDRYGAQESQHFMGTAGQLYEYELAISEQFQGWLENICPSWSPYKQEPVETSRLK